MHNAYRLQFSTAVPHPPGDPGWTWWEHRTCSRECLLSRRDVKRILGRSVSRRLCEEEFYEQKMDVSCWRFARVIQAAGTFELDPIDANSRQFPISACTDAPHWLHSQRDPFASRLCWYRVAQPAEPEKKQPRRAARYNRVNRKLRCTSRLCTRTERLKKKE